MYILSPCASYMNYFFGDQFDYNLFEITGEIIAQINDPPCSCNSNKAHGLFLLFHYVHGEISQNTIQHCSEMVRKSRQTHSLFVRAVHYPPISIGQANQGFYRIQWKHGSYNIYN